MDKLIRLSDAVEAMRKLQAEDDEDYGVRIIECFPAERAIEALEALETITGI